MATYEWLCGQRPFEGSASEVMVQQLTIPPPPLHEKVATIPLGIEQVVLRALSKDPKDRFASVQDFAAALEQASQYAHSPTTQLASESPAPDAAPAAGVATVAVPTLQPALPNETPSELAAPPASPQTPPDLTIPADLALGVPLAATTPVPSIPPPPLEPTLPVRVRRKGMARRTAALLIGLAVLVVAGGVLGSVSLLSHFGVIGAHSVSPALQPIRGGTWTNDFFVDPDSFIPNGSSQPYSLNVDQALYLPLFYGDAQGVIHTGAATEVPTIQNGGVSPDATLWTFHLRPHLVWSDGQPYDARDVDFTWKLLTNPQFFAGYSFVINLIRSADVSANYLSITFHLKRSFVPFLADFWVDGSSGPLPAHHFSKMPPDQILKSPDNLNPTVTSGPFMMSESKPGDHYTLVRNPHYFRADEGLPFLDKLVFRIVDLTTGTGWTPVLKEIQAGSIDSTLIVDIRLLPTFQHLTNYTLVTTPTSAGFEGLYFNFHNTVLASHLEVRQAIAMAIDHQALIDTVQHGAATLLCTDHPSALHPGYQPDAPCWPFDAVAANKLLDDNGWVKGADGVRARSGQRLEFEYSTTVTYSPERIDGEAIIQHNLQAIGIKLDIQNYEVKTFFGPFLTGGKASPPTGAVAGRYDIAEWAYGYGYDPDDSSQFACDQFPSAANNFSGGNTDFYCNPALDALYAQELVTADPGVRQQIFNQLHHLYLTELPFITLYSALLVSIVRKGTHNYQPGPFSYTYNIWEWWCDHGKC